MVNVIVQCKVGVGCCLGVGYCQQWCNFDFGGEKYYMVVFVQWKVVVWGRDY